MNDVITNYATDPRVDSPFEDPTACQYVSKEILLENPASSIKIILSAYLNEDADLRAFYAVSNEEGTDPVFSPFPGYSNLNTRGEVISAEDSNGLPDSFVVKSSSFSFEPYQTDYREYVFTVNDLPSFRNYRIKLNLASKNQCYVPKIKELRVIALAWYGFLWIKR